MDLFELVGRILIKNQEANEEIDKTTEKAKGLGDALGGAGTSADNTASKMGSTSAFNSAAVWMGNTLYKLTEKAVTLGTNLGKLGFGFNASMESYQYSFSALLQDEEKAKQLVADIQELAKVSPLGLEGLAKNAVSLLNTGTELTEIIPTLEMLGNLALGNPQNMDSVVRAFTQIISKGGLMAQEMYQLGDAMVPIKEIMTKYGGERYADGSWYEQKMKDPTFKIPAEDMVKAFQAATAEGGQWNDYMLTMMDTFAGKYDRLGEEGKETLGDFFKPFFEMAKSDVLPGLIESLDRFRTWISENQEPLQKLAETVGNIVTVGFDSFLGALQWMFENGETTGAAITTIATAMGLALASAHPLAASVLVIAGGLALLKSRSDELKSGDIFDKYSEDELATLQKYVEALKEMKAAEAVKAQSGDSPAEVARWEAAKDAVNQYAREVNKTDGLMEDYFDYSRKQGGNTEQGIIIDLPVKTADDSENNVQTEINSWTLESLVKMYADATGIQAYLNSMNFTAYADVVARGSTGGDTGSWDNPYAGGGEYDNGWGNDYSFDGSHAKGLDFVPRDGYLARLHYGEAVLNRAQADAFRSFGMGGDTSRLEAMFGQMVDMMRQFVSTNHGGQQIVLDSGVLVGQLAPALDTQLGTISSRKGRRN